MAFPDYSGLLQQDGAPCHTDKNCSGVTRETRKKRSQDSIRFLMRLLRPQIICGTCWNNPWMPKLTTLRNQRIGSGCDQGILEAIAMGKCTQSATVIHISPVRHLMLRVTGAYPSPSSVCNFLKRRQSLLLPKTCRNGCDSVWDSCFWNLFEVLVKEWSFGHWSGGSACCCFFNQPFCLCRSPLQYQPNLPLSFFNVLHK